MAGITKYSKAISALSENEFQFLTLHVILLIFEPSNVHKVPQALSKCLSKWINADNFKKPL